jgi:hypothetical protein
VPSQPRITPDEVGAYETIVPPSRLLLLLLLAALLLTALLLAAAMPCTAGSTSPGRSKGRPRRCLPFLEGGFPSRLCSGNDALFSHVLLSQGVALLLDLP